MKPVWQKEIQPVRCENGETGSRVNDSRSLTAAPDQEVSG